MIQWECIADKIMDFIDLDEDNRPLYNRVTSMSKRLEGIDRTLFSPSSDELWVYEDEDKAIVLFHLFHECWHAYQKSQGVDIQYSKEDREKYVGKKHMMMLYKYSFEAEATGYASAFVYELYKTAKLKNSDCFGKEIEDCYTNIDTFPKDQFDTHEDFIKINERIKFYYEQGKEYIESKINNSVIDNIEN